MAPRIPIACTLTDAQAASQLDEWGELRARALAVESITGGVRVVLPVESEAITRDLAAREAACCAFLTLAVERDDAELTLTITGPSEAQPIIGLIIHP
ncbi:MAG: hypothetical protein AAGA37_21985 [Actinomycetota bacterium]